MSTLNLKLAIAYRVKDARKALLEWEYLDASRAKLIARGSWSSTKENYYKRQLQELSEIVRRGEQGDSV